MRDYLLVVIGFGGLMAAGAAVEALASSVFFWPAFGLAMMGGLRAALKAGLI